MAQSWHGKCRGIPQWFSTDLIMKTIDEFDGSGDAESLSPARHDTLRGDTSITLYLREIGQVKLLTRQEEIELAARVKKGDKEAREQMIKANLRLVVKIARDFEAAGLPLLDLISEGNIGLMKAVERYDPSKGAKLSFYAAWWIKQEIRIALARQSKIVRLPMHVVDKLSQMGRAALRLEEELGRTPIDEELAEEMGMPSLRLIRMRMAAIRPLSLDASIDGEDSRSYAELIADEKAESPSEQMESKVRKAMLQEGMQRLDRTEQAVLHSRFGLDGKPPKTLPEVGKELGFSGERARQIQQTALWKLRRRIKKLEKSLSV